MSIYTEEWLIEMCRTPGGRAEVLRLLKWGENDPMDRKPPGKAQWKAWERLTATGHRYVGTFDTEEEAASKIAKTGGYIEPTLLTSRESCEYGFPKSYQKFIERETL